MLKCKNNDMSLHYKKKQKLPTRQIHRKCPNCDNKLIVYKFIDEFLSPSVITDEFRINLSVNSSINLTTDDIRR